MSHSDDGERMEQPLIPLTFTRDEVIAIGAAITLARMHVSRENTHEATLAQLEQLERRFLEAVGRKAES